MGIEKVAGSAATPYQGSSAVQAAQTAPEAHETVIRMPRKAESVSRRQDFSLPPQGTGAVESEVAEDAGKQTPQLKTAVNDLNKQMTSSEAVFRIHEKTNRVTIKIVDKSTKEVLKEYPPEQTLDMIAKIWEIAGILVDEKR